MYFKNYCTNKAIPLSLLKIVSSCETFEGFLYKTSSNLGGRIHSISFIDEWGIEYLFSIFRDTTLESIDDLGIKIERDALVKLADFSKMFNLSSFDFLPNRITFRDFSIDSFADRFKLIWVTNHPVVLEGMSGFERTANGYFYWTKKYIYAYSYLRDVRKRDGTVRKQFDWKVRYPIDKLKFNPLELLKNGSAISEKIIDEYFKEFFDLLREASNEK